MTHRVDKPKSTGSGPAAGVPHKLAATPAQMTFGNGIPIADMRHEARSMSFEDFRAAHGKLFLLVHIADIAGAASDTSKTHPSAGRPAPILPPSAVFPLKRRAGSQFDWIAVGRNEGNDVFLPHASISRFHAFFRDMGSTWMLQDARSSNGTFLGDTPVPRHGEGQPVPVQPGNTVRFGDVVATILNTEGLFAILTKLT